MARLVGATARQRGVGRIIVGEGWRVSPPWVTRVLWCLGPLGCDGLYAEAVSEFDCVLQTVSLGQQWPTVDPFLFCVHHDDAYPLGNEQYGPDAPRAGRSIGQDFAGKDGWNLYHGDAVAGFPRHPHRGFETVTFVRKGLVDHADSLGAAARFGRGDVQWMTAGGGVVHSEMFPLLERLAPNPLELFQIWLNLPAADKMVPAYFTMLWADQLPRYRVPNEGGTPAAATVTVLAGAFAGGELEAGCPPRAPSPPPDSWAARPQADLAIWHLQLDAGTQITLAPPVSDQAVRTVYLFEGDGLQLGTQDLANMHAAVLRPGVPARMVCGRRPAELLMLQGVPLGEPVVRHGPFVMNDRAGIEAAFADYQRTGFGGWPWPEDGPVHGADPTRFARHADGRLERRSRTSPGWAG